MPRQLRKRQPKCLYRRWIGNSKCRSTHSTPPLVNYLTHSVKLSEMITGHETVKKFPIFYGNRRYITAFTNSRHLFLCWASSVHLITSSHFLKIHFNPILPSSPRSAKWFLFLKFPHQNPMWNCPVSHTCQLPCPSHSSLIAHLNNSRWEVQIIQFLITSSS